MAERYNMLLEENRTIQILRKAEEGKYGILAQSWYVEGQIWSWTIANAADIVMTLNRPLHSCEQQSARGAQQSSTYSLSHLHMAEVPSCNSA